MSNQCGPVTVADLLKAIGADPKKGIDIISVASTVPMEGFWQISGVWPAYAFRGEMYFRDVATRKLYRLEFTGQEEQFPLPVGFSRQPPTKAGWYWLQSPSGERCVAKRYSTQEASDQWDNVLNEESGRIITDCQLERKGYLFGPPVNEPGVLL